MDEPEEIADRPDAVELPNGGGHLSFEGVGFEYIEGRPCWRTSTSTSRLARGSR